MPIFSSTTNAETTLHFLSIWKPIFRMMLRFHCKIRNLNREHFLAECIIKANRANMVDLICEITGVDKARMGAKNLQYFQPQEQVKTIPDPIAFVKMPDYKPEVKEELVAFLTLLFRFLIGEGEEVSDWGSINDGNSGK